MSISESQLDTWSHQGSVTQSKDTYSSLRRALESDRASYQSRDFEPFLQGSYGNDTNIYAESDVDVVARLDATFYFDIDDLSLVEQQAFNNVFGGGASYGFDAFKADVIGALNTAFLGAVTPGKKAIKIAASGSRRSADVLAAAQFRHYRRFTSPYDCQYDEGICFFTGSRTIVNYPRQHSANCTAKHQATNGWFKPTVRILKNVRRAMVSDGLIAKGIAPSYFLEGLLYNVPNDKFGGSYVDTIVSSINWIMESDRSGFVSANERFVLFGNEPETWPTADYDQFIHAFVRYWNECS